MCSGQQPYRYPSNLAMDRFCIAFFAVAYLLIGLWIDLPWPGVGLLGMVGMIFGSWIAGIAERIRHGQDQ